MHIQTIACEQPSVTCFHPVKYCYRLLLINNVVQVKYDYLDDGV